MEVVGTTTEKHSEINDFISDEGEGITERPLTDDEVIAMMRQELAAENELPDIEVLDREAQRTRNIELLISHYDEQQFKYKSHQGTITGMINLCPPIQNMLEDAGGFDAIVNWIDDCKVKPESVDEDAEGSDEKSDAEEHTAVALNDDVKKPLATQETPRTPQKHEAVIPKKDAENERVPQDAPLKTSTQPIVNESKTKAFVSKTDNHIEPQFTIKPVSVSAPPTDATPIIEMVVEPRLSIKESTEHTHSINSPQSEETPILNEIKEDYHLIESDDTIERVMNNEVTSFETASELVEAGVPIESTVSLTEEKVSQLSEIHVDEERNIIAEASYEAIGDLAQEPIIIPSSEILKEWQDFGENKQPLEIALVSMVEALSQFEDTDNGEESKKPNMMSVIDAPELQIVLRRVEKSRTALERLMNATTQEECHENVCELIKEVSQLLTLIGYENPNRVIQNFIAHHSIQSLRDLLEYLEVSLRYSLEKQSTISITMKRDSRHGSQLAKFAMRLLTLFVPQYELANT